MDTQQLCQALMFAESENEVINLLREEGYWDDPKCWRTYGDNENNFAVIGNQQSKPDAALVEKIVNSVDARLILECLLKGIDPEGPEAPISVREAVAVFFEKKERPIRLSDGRIKNWSDRKRTEVARGITVAATGFSPKLGNPCLTISDCGEGQTPEKFPDTFLSLTRTNKLRIPFVQGKFNMGGTGVLQFCGKKNLQLIVSRRHPELVPPNRKNTSDDCWGFTVVRREDPSHGRRSSVYTYLAPIGVEKNPGKGEVLYFQANEMPIFPEGRRAYARTSAWGTLIKLYEYTTSNYSKTHILRKDALLGRVDLLLPEIALPIRLHECRGEYRGHQGSFETTITGVGVRLDDDKTKNLEPGFPDSTQIVVEGEKIIINIYAFKKGRAETYRKNEGVIFTINGQTQGYLTTDFFRRKKVGMSYLANSILIVADCSDISGRAREDLFMNSRDRLRGGELRRAIEDALEDLLAHHSGLRALREKRRREEIESKVADAKPLRKVLENVLKSSPVLCQLFNEGNQLSNPFKTMGVQSKEQPFHGKLHPTFFKFKGKDYGTVLERDCHINLRCRIVFETDACNDYFSRKEAPGDFQLVQIINYEEKPLKSYTLNLRNGIATLSLCLPDGVQVGDKLQFITRVSDDTLTGVRQYRGIY